ncbi:hypothetical protein BDR22DRAFT_891035 [Usnea florida]
MAGMDLCSRRVSNNLNAQAKSSKSLANYDGYACLSCTKSYDVFQAYCEMILLPIALDNCVDRSFQHFFALTLIFILRDAHRHYRCLTENFFEVVLLGDEDLPDLGADKRHALECALWYLRTKIAVESLHINLTLHEFGHSAEDKGIDCVKVVED